MKRRKFILKTGVLSLSPFLPNVNLDNLIIPEEHQRIVMMLVLDIMK